MYIQTNTHNWHSCYTHTYIYNNKMILALLAIMLRMSTFFVVAFISPLLLFFHVYTLYVWLFIFFFFLRQNKNKTEKSFVVGATGWGARIKHTCFITSHLLVVTTFDFGCAKRTVVCFVLQTIASVDDLNANVACYEYLFNFFHLFELVVFLFV